MRIGSCAYCGGANETDDHVIPKSLYPPSTLPKGPQLITVPACETCNKSFQDDETHFRAVLLHAGNPNAAVQELYDGPFSRSLKRCDADRRKRDLRAICRRETSEQGERTKIYPAEDVRVLRIVKKICRGLAAHHGVRHAVCEEAVWADVLRYQIPPGLSFDWLGAVPDVARYAYVLGEAESDVHSFWLLRFYESRVFIGSIQR